MVESNRFQGRGEACWHRWNGGCVVSTQRSNETVQQKESTGWVSVEDYSNEREVVSIRSKKGIDSDLMTILRR